MVARWAARSAAKMVAMTVVPWADGMVATLVGRKAAERVVSLAAKTAGM